MPGKGLEESSEDAQAGRGGQAAQARGGKGQVIKRSKVRNQFFKNNPDLQNTIPELPSVFSRTHCFQQEHETVMDYEPIFTSINMFIIEAGLVSLKTGTLCGWGTSCLCIINNISYKHPFYLCTSMALFKTFNGQRPPGDRTRQPRLA